MVCRLVANFLTMAEMLVPAARSSRTSCFCFSLSVEGTAKGLSFRLGTLVAGLRPFDQQISLELGNGVKHVNCHRSGRAGEIGAAKREVIDPNSDFGQGLNCGADVDRITAEAVEFRHD